ncbi:MAG: hypothetical protein KAG97_03345, partial [Victivallales bacterium]|nr:hypothetical protein [Victivallales bacterium]
MDKNYLETHPDENGYFGKFGGAYLPPQLMDHFKEISELYEKISGTNEFIDELCEIREHYQGRPTPIYHARNLSAAHGSANIYFKREDLNHTGA